MNDTTYRAADLEPVPPSGIRIGDRIAVAGPRGSGTFTGRRVTSVGIPTADGTVRIETDTVTYQQPSWLRVWRVR